jgi:hypothetical protein
MARITELDEFYPLTRVAREFGCTVMDLVNAAAAGVISVRVPYLDEVVTQVGQSTGTHFWIYCSLPRPLVQQLIVEREIEVDTMMLLMGTFTPASTGSRRITWAEDLLRQRTEGGYGLRPKTSTHRIRWDYLGVMERELELVRRVLLNSGRLGLMRNGVSDESKGGCAEKFTLYWLEQKLLDEPHFAEEALQKLTEIEQQQPEKFRSTYTTASSASALINHWLVNRDLTAYERGKPVEDFAALWVEPIECTLGEAIDLLQASIEILRSDLVSLIEREGMTAPNFLMKSPDVSSEISLAEKRDAARFNHDLEWQEQANAIAAQLTEANRGRKPTKGKVAIELAKRLTLTRETVERRIRKKW